MAEYIVTVDGKKYRVKSDQPLSEAEAYQYATQQAGFTAPKEEDKPQTRAEAVAAGTPRKARTTGETVGHYGSFGGRKALKGIANTGEFILDSALGEWSPGRGLPMAADWISDKLGLDNPETATERVVGAGVEAGAGSIGGVGLRKAAVEGVAGALSGMAAQGTKEAGLGPGWQMAAGLGAGVAPAALASTARHTAASAPILNRVRGVDPGTRVSRKMRQAATDAESARASVINRPRVQGDLDQIAQESGAQPTLAEMAQDPGIAAFQRDNMTTPVQTRQRENIDARTNAIDQNLDPNADPQMLQNAATVQGLQNEAALEAAQQKVGPLGERRPEGAETRGHVEADYNAAIGRSTAAYQVPEIQNNVKLDVPKTIFKDMRALRRERYGYGGGTPPAEVTRIGQEIRRQVRMGRMTTKHVGNYDKRLADFAGNANMEGRRNEADYAENLRRILAKHSEESMPPATAAAWKNARAVRLDQGQRFEQGSVGEIFGKGKFGEVAVGDTEIPGALTGKGAAGGTIADDIIAAIGPDKSEKAIRGELRRLIDAGGVPLKEGKATGFEEMLKRFPALESDVKQLVEHSSFNAKFAKSDFGKLADPSVTPAAHVKSILNGQGDERAFNAFLDDIQKTGDKEAIGGLRRTLSQYIADAGKTGSETALDGTRITGNKATMDAVDKVLTKASSALTSEQKEALTRLRSELANVEAVNTAGVVPKRDNRRTPTPFVGGTTARTFGWLAHFSNDKAVADLIEQAILNPKIGADLLKRPTIDRVKAVKRTIRRAATGATFGVMQPDGPGLYGSVTDTSPAIPGAY